MMRSKKKGIVLNGWQLAALLVIVLLMVFGGVLIGSKLSESSETAEVQSTDTAPAGSAPALDIDPNAGNWEGQTPEDKGGAAVGIKIPGYPSITVQKDVTDVKMALLNPEGNPCYFKFEIVLKDTGETIYESQYVPPGQSIEDVTLTRPLSEGEYEATIMITTIALDQVTPLNGANVETVLIAK